MEYKDFEKYIANQYKKEEADIDTNQLLKNLNLPVQQASTGMNFLYWLLPLVFLLGGISTFYYFSNSQKEENKNEIENPTQISLLEETSGSEKTAINNDLITIKEDKKESDLQNLNSSDNSIEKGDINFDNVKIANVNLLKEGNRKNSDSKTIKRTNLSDTGNSIENDAVASEPAQKDAENAIKLANFEAEKLNSNNKEISLKADKTSISEALFEDQITKSKQNTSYIETFDITDDNMVAEFNFPGIIECPDLDKRKFSMFGGFEIGYGLPVKTLYSKSSPDDVYYDRLQNEKSLEAIDLLAYGLVGMKNKPFYAKVGVNVFRISERMNFEQTSISQDTSYGIISTTISPTGDTVSHVYGDIITETTSYNKSKVHYYINQINLPISLVYHQNLGRAVFQLEGGINFNLHTWTSGLLLAEQEKFISLDALRLFRKQMGISYFGRLNFIQSVGIRNKVYLSPQFLFNPNDWTTQNNEIGQKYQNWSIKAGYIYQFR